jgi:hypothetical protein
VAGVAIGGLFGGSVWLVSTSPVLTAAVGIVWAAAAAASLYVFTTHSDPEDAGPWGAVVGGSVSFGAVLNLADIGVSNGASAALTLLVIGFTLLGYVAGLAAVQRSKDANHTADSTTVVTTL